MWGNEDKLNSLKNDHDYLNQLKANMVLLTSVLLKENIDQNLSNVKNITQIICYGLLVGPLQPLMLLKSSMHFDQGTLNFYLQAPMLGMACQIVCKQGRDNA